MKKVISVLLSLVMLLSSFSVMTVAGAAQAKAPAYVGDNANLALVQSNANLGFYLNQNTGDFAVLNLKSGKIWFSNPVGIEKTYKDQPEVLAELSTKVKVDYLSSSYQKINVASGEASIITERNGEDWIVTFYFKGNKRDFSVPVLFRLQDEYLHMELLIDRICEFGDSRVLDVQLYPFFGAANMKENGYVLYPDGTGSIMEFNQAALDHPNHIKIGVDPVVTNNSQTPLDCLGQVYGSNAMEIMNSHYVTDWHENIHLPIVGMVKNGEAYLNIFDQGAALATAYAELAHTSTHGYNISYLSVNVRETQGRKNATGTGGAGFYYTDQTPDNFVSRYYFMTGSDANYIGMANCYRNYLITEKGMAKVKADASNALCINLYGAVKKSQHLLGIPYTGSEELTSYSEAAELVDRLKESGIEKAYINYTGWAQGGLETTMTTDFDASSALGGSADLEELVNKVAETDHYNISFDLDLQAFYGANSDVTKMDDTATGLDLMPITIYQKRLFASGARDTTKIDKQLIHPGCMAEYAAEFMTNAMAESVVSFSFNSIGNSLYSSYNNDDEHTLDRAAAVMESILKKAKEDIGEKGLLSTSGGNGYAMPYVDVVVDAPITSSNYVFALKEIPFFQIVFRGYVNMAGSAMNLDSEKDIMLLKHAETGMSLYYDLMDADSTSFHDTNFTSRYACGLDDHYDNMIKAYEKLSVVYKAVGDSMITDHQIVPANKVKADGRVADNDVKITTFENGAKVYVNYSDSKVVVDNVEIGAKDFKVVGGAEA